MVLLNVYTTNYLLSLFFVETTPPFYTTTHKVANHFILCTLWCTLLYLMCKLLPMEFLGQGLCFQLWDVLSNHQPPRQNTQQFTFSLTVIESFPYIHIKNKHYQIFPTSQSSAKSPLKIHNSKAK